EEMGGAKMHCSVSGCGDVLVKSEEEAIKYTQQYLSYFPANFREKPRIMNAKEIGEVKKTITELIPENQNAPFNMKDIIKHLIDADSLCKINKKIILDINTVLNIKKNK